MYNHADESQTKDNSANRYNPIIVAGKMESPPFWVGHKSVLSSDVTMHQNNILFPFDHQADTPSAGPHDVNIIPLETSP